MFKSNYSCSVVKALLIVILAAPNRAGVGLIGRIGDLMESTATGVLNN